MSSLVEIRKRKLEEMMNSQGESSAQQSQMQQQVLQLERIAKKYLDRDAISRYGNIKAANSEKAIQILVVINRLIQSGKINGVINDATFKDLLLQLIPEKKEMKINKV